MMPDERGQVIWRQASGASTPPGQNWRAVRVTPGLFLPSVLSRPPCPDRLTSILHICIPGLVMLREPLTWALSLVMVMDLVGRQCGSKA